jgi:hypothetical protein
MTCHDVLTHMLRTRIAEGTGTNGPFRASLVPRPGQAFQTPPTPTEASIGVSIPHGSMPGNSQVKKPIRIQARYAASQDADQQ